MSTEYHRFALAENGKTLLTGIRKLSKHEYLISGWYQSNGGQVLAFVYRGALRGGGRFYDLAVPSAPGATVISTNLYGPNHVDKDVIRVVGNFTLLEQPGGLGCLYEGKLDGSGTWTNIVPTGLTSDPVLNTIAHSTHGDLVVGNFDTQLTRGRAFLYNILDKTYVEIKPTLQVASITAYGVWHNGGHSYTVCGGYVRGGLPPNPEGPSERAYLLDWDNERKQFSNFRSFTYKNRDALITHFNGITGAKNSSCNSCKKKDDGYYLTGDTQHGIGSEKKAFLAHVSRKSRASWKRLQFPGSQSTSGNSVAETDVVGVYLDQRGGIRGYTSTTD